MRRERCWLYEVERFCIILQEKEILFPCVLTKDYIIVGSLNITVNYLYKNSTAVVVAEKSLDIAQIPLAITHKADCPLR